MKPYSGSHLRVHCTVIDLPCPVCSLSTWLGKRTGGMGWFWVERPKLSCSLASNWMCSSHKPSSSLPFFLTYVPGMGWGWHCVYCLMICKLLDLTVVFVSSNSVIPTVDARTIDALHYSRKK